jgi:iduronate 2-sulfatase
MIKVIMKEKRSIMFFIVFVIMATAVFPTMIQAQESQERPNVVFITADDLSANRLGPYGNTVVKTPQLDAFAKESLTFNRAYCQVPQCGQSRNSIFTGIRPETSGLWKLQDKWREALPNAVSMQRHFINNGYSIDEIGKLFDPRSGPKDYEAGGPKPASADAPIEKLEALATSEDPFALFIGFGEPHPVTWDTYEKRGKYRDYIDLYDPKSLDLQGTILSKEKNITTLANEETTREELATVYGVISYLDHEVGRILQKVKDLGLWDNTIVIFWCADHGYRYGEGIGVGIEKWPGDRWGKWYPDETDAHVPLLMRVPGTAGIGKQTSGIVECIDMYQTLMELCSLDDPQQDLEGHSFAPLFDFPDCQWKDAAFTTYLTGNKARSIATQNYRLIHNGDLVELYDLENDPRGLVNIANENQDIVDELTKRLKAGPNLNWQPTIPSKPN